MSFPHPRRRRRVAGQLAWLDVTGRDDPLDAGLADVDWLDDPVLDDAALVAAAPLAPPTAITATRPANVAAVTPVAKNRARAAT